MDSLGIIFELQWKKKNGVGNRGSDIASLGIWDTADSSLDWRTFKSYLSQNLGTCEDITVAYVDSEGDELPIESECEFHEALKFARQRARKGHNIVLKVDKEEMPSPPIAETSEKKRWRQVKHVKSPAMDGKRNSVDKPFKKVLAKDWEELLTYNTMLVDKVAQLTNVKAKMDEQHKKPSQVKPERDDVPPAWFKKYMSKMKNEIITEVNNHTKQMLASMVVPPPVITVERTRRELVVPKSKKRVSDEDSSDAALGSDQRDHKLLRKIEKLHKREKKLEKKLDSKLEKLENKTKRMMEKKSQAKLRPEWERLPEKKTLRKRSSDGPVGTYLMDAILLNDSPKAEAHIKLGKRFTKIWEIMNNGTLPWTDKTELRLAWGTLGLEPEDSVVKCPILEPGEKGQIAVNFRAPDFPGTFESYWHFYHMGDRFGHWIGCAVVVEEPHKSEKSGFNLGHNVKVDSGLLSKPGVSSEKGDIGNYEKLDNVETLNDKPLRVAVRSDDASTSQNLNCKVVETEAAENSLATEKSDDVSNMAANHPNNNNINAAQPSGNPQPETRGPEYESDSDDDNLSIISTISRESDDDKFVIVPMPACFIRDMPLGYEHFPIGVRKTEKNLPGLAASSNSDDKPDSTTVTSEPTEEIQEGAVGGEIIPDEDENFSSMHSYEAGEKWWDSEDFKPNVYAVDSCGSCIPLETAWPSSETTRIPLGYAAKPVASPKRKQSDPEQASVQAESKVEAMRRLSQTQANQAILKARLSQSQGKKTFSHSSSFAKGTSESSQSKSKTVNFSSERGTSTEANYFSPSEQEAGSKVPLQGTDAAAVHILPETIVNGAINVASSAYNKAQAFIDHLRTRQQGERYDPNLGAMSSSQNLRVLSDMGFRNRNLNVILLQRFDNDIAEVVAELLRGNDQPGLH